MTWTPETVAAVIAAFGLGPIMAQTVTGVIKWRTGAQARERAESRWAIEDRDEAEARARAADRTSDRLRRERDAWRELAMQQRLRMIAADIDPGDLPTCPDT